MNERAINQGMGNIWQHAAPAAPALGAQAYTQGNHVPITGAGGGESLAHEAWHVVQQKQGRVAPSAAAAAPFAGQF